MEQEFTTSTGYKIAYGFFSFALLIGSIFLMFLGAGRPGNTGPMVFIAILCLGFGIAIAINLYKRKAVVTDESVAYSNLWRSKEFFKADIKGFRVGEKAILIESAVEGYGKITIGDYTSIGKYKDLIRWLDEYYTDLNATEYAAERNEMLQDTSLGRTEEDRDSTLKKMRQLTMYYTFGGLGLFIFTCYAHINNPVLAIVALIYPIAGIAIMAFSKGIIWLFAKKTSAHPAMFSGLFIASLSAAIQSSANSHLLSYDNLWIPAIVFAIIISAILYYLAVKKANAALGSQVVFIIMTSIVFGFSSSLSMNCTLDPSSPQVYTAAVTDIHVSHGKSTTYHVVLGQWGQHEEGENVSVSAAFYNQVQVGSQVKVNLKKGLLNVPWFYLSK